MKIRSTTRKLGKISGSLALASAGFVGVVGTAVLGVATPASAASETLNYSCAIPILGAQNLPVTITATAPATATTGSTITVNGTASIALPASLIGAAGALGATAFQITAASSVVNATGPVTPTSATVSATGIPFSETIAQLQAGPITVTLAPATFTAGGSAGTVNFMPGNFSSTAVITGGSLGGQSEAIPCTVPATGVTPVASTVVSAPSLTSQAITFTSTAPPATVGGSYTVAATGGASGNPVTFTVDAGSTAGACTISGANVSFTGVGTCTIDANQAGNASFTAAPQVQQKITVAPTVQGPVGAVGALALAALAGSTLFLVQRRRHRSLTAGP